MPAFLMLLAITFLSCKPSESMIDKETVSPFHLDRFLGKWYEIARYPHSFEKGLVGVTAEYSLREDVLIKVVNKGFKEELSGKLSTAVGKAKVPNPSVPSHLRVSFFWIFYSDYLVLELDHEAYQWAVIGSSSDKYLWVLSRSPQMSEKQYKTILHLIKERGYSLDQLIKVPQAAEPNLE